MSATQNTVQYTVSLGPQGTTSGGTEFNGDITLFISAGSDFTDADAFALRAALLAALPSGWNIASGDFSIYKTDSSVTTFTTNLTATPPSFT